MTEAFAFAGFALAIIALFVAADGITSLRGRIRAIEERVGAVDEVAKDINRSA